MPNCLLVSSPGYIPSNFTVQKFNNFQSYIYTILQSKSCTHDSLGVISLDLKKHTRTHYFSIVIPRNQSHSSCSDSTSFEHVSSTSKTHTSIHYLHVLYLFHKFYLCNKTTRVTQQGKQTHIIIIIFDSHPKPHLILYFPQLTADSLAPSPHHHGKTGLLLLKTHS